MTTSENNFENKCKKMQELFFGKQRVKEYYDLDDILNYTSDVAKKNINNTNIYTSRYDTDNLAEYCTFNIRLVPRSSNLSNCDKFYELFFNKTQLNNDSNNKEFIDADGVKYTSHLDRDNSYTNCHFKMEKFRNMQSKYF